MITLRCPNCKRAAETLDPDVRNGELYGSVCRYCGHDSVDDLAFKAEYWSPLPAFSDLDSFHKRCMARKKTTMVAEHRDFDLELLLDDAMSIAATAMRSQLVPEGAS